MVQVAVERAPPGYPGEIDGKRSNKAQLEAAMKPVVEFQRKYNVHIYIGEFSAIRWRRTAVPAAT